MKSAITLCFVPLLAAGLFAQGPRGGGFGGRGGFEGPAGFAGRGPGVLGAGPGDQASLTGAPYSAIETLQIQQRLADGNQISTKEQANVYRDSQGRIRTEMTVGAKAAEGKPAYSLVTIFDPVGGFRYVLNSSTMVANQAPLPRLRATRPPNRPDRPERPTRPNETTTDLGTQVVNGVAAKGTQFTQTIPAGAIGNAQAIQVVRVTWISTELKVPVQIKTSDPRSVTSDMELTSIVQTEPSAALFVVPAGYTVQQDGGGRGRGGPDGLRPQGRRGPGPR